MSLYWKNAEIMASQAHLLGELFDHLRLREPISCPRRANFLRKIGESLDFEDKYIDTAIDDPLNLMFEAPINE